MPEAFGLYLILTRPVAGYERCAEAAVEARVRYLQLRMKRQPRSEILDVAGRLRRITRGARTLFIVNDSVDIAREVDADGVHLGQEDTPIPEARQLWREPGKIFGLSTHGEHQERLARELRPDYIGVGPVFPTATKDRPDATLGLERMGSIVRSSPLTTVAIGGISADNLAEVLRHGAVNFAVVRAVNQNPDPKSAIQMLQDIWREHCAGS